MTTLSEDFKRTVADLFSKNIKDLDNYDPQTMESFATNVLKTINKEKKKSSALHDLEILEYNMSILKTYASKLKEYKPDTDEYDFTRNDCKNLVDSTKKWLNLEGLL
jgi:hypothetical protein